MSCAGVTGAGAGGDGRCANPNTAEERRTTTTRGYLNTRNM
jgi:hypothetical protein